MLLLALGTWWLVKNTPSADAPSESALPRKEPDYTMDHFVVERFDKDGRLKVRMQGERLRHFADTDDHRGRPGAGARGGGRRPRHLAQARRAIANGDGSEVQLIGDARGRQHRAARRADPVPRRVPACLPQHRARALAPARGGDQRRQRVPRRRHGLRPPERAAAAAGQDARAAAAVNGGRTAGSPCQAAPSDHAIGLHHRRVQRHRPGAGAALRPRRLATGAGGAARRRAAGLGRRAGPGCRTGRHVYAADVRDVRSIVECRPGLHRAAGPARCGGRQRRHQRGHRHRRLRRPGSAARHLRDQQHRHGGHLPSLRRRRCASAAAAAWWALPAWPASAACPGMAPTAPARRRPSATARACAANARHRASRW